MANTKEGGIKGAKTNKERYGESYYRQLGHIGGKVTGTAKGFAAKDNASQFGKLGGQKSRRARVLTKNSKLRPDEINVLIPLGIRALGTLRLNGVIQLDKEQLAHVDLYESAGHNRWVYIFSDCGVGPSIQLSWSAVLSNEIANYKNRINAGEELSDEDEDRYRIIRNLAKAFTVATGYPVSGFKVKLKKKGE